MRVQRRLFRQYGFVTISHVVEIAFLISFDLACTRIHTGKRTLAEKYRTLQIPSVYKSSKIFG